MSTVITNALLVVDQEMLYLFRVDHAAVSGSLAPEQIPYQPVQFTTQPMLDWDTKAHLASLQILIW